jgi:hypothetical protein
VEDDQQRGVVDGRVPGPADLTRATGQKVPTKNASAPLGSTPLGQSEPEIIEPNAVYAHLSYGVSLHRCKRPIFDKGAGSPSAYDIRQGAVFNCPLPAFLAAMVYTQTFASKIKIKQINDPAVSVQGDDKKKVDRYFEVKFPNNPSKERSNTTQPVKATDFFWGSGSCKMQYARSFRKDIWVSLIEKAFTKIAASNSYNRLSDATRGPHANTVIEFMYGVEFAHAVKIQGKSDNDLKALIKNATKVPTIMRWAAPGANQAHAVTVEGLDPVDDHVNWIDSLSGVTSSNTLKEVKEQFDYILYP